MKINKNEGAGSLYHPEILENPAARPGHGHAPATAATGPGHAPATHFFQAMIDYNTTPSISLVLYHCQYSNSSSTPKVCYHPPEKRFTPLKQFHTPETIPAPCSWPGLGPWGCNLLGDTFLLLWPCGGRTVPWWV